jgi:hypothetical protein
MMMMLMMMMVCMYVNRAKRGVLLEAAKLLSHQQMALTNCRMPGVTAS